MTKKVILILLGLIVPVIWAVKSIEFTQDCKGYLKQAADANSVELAIECLDKAIAYTEVNNLTDGYTSVLWRTEDDNVGFWYKNLKTCRKELEDCKDSSQLEQTNVLLKVRESLLDHTADGTVVTLPKGISRYPNNALWGILMWISIIIFLTGCVISRW